MIIQTKNNYNRFFFAFLLSVILTFFYLRPLRSPWHPFIAGDGLGYYAYLPAIFIYHDTDLKFEWFNKAYNTNYVYSSFDNPEDNLLVKYKDKKINKYYQGLSFVWLPFFFVAHGVAKVFHFNADGFSLPYQWSIGLSSLLYLLLGLFYLKKLIHLIFNDERIACMVPVFIFYGSHLFNFSIYANSMSHVYSFTFNVLMVYFFTKLVRQNEMDYNSLLLFLLFLILSICIRPLNAIMILALPVFVNDKIKWRHFHIRFTLLNISLIGIVGALLFYQLKLMFVQTGTFLPYTYSNEHFNFRESKFFEALWSYHIGYVFYVPLILLSLALSIFSKWKRYFLLSLLFLLILFIYSSWWYWPILRRSMIDAYFIPAVGLAAFLNEIKSKRFMLVSVLVLILTTVVYQLKDYQIRKGILSEFSTYGEVYWRNYFRLTKANTYFIPPESIVTNEKHFVDFEGKPNASEIKDKVFSGKNALELNAKTSFSEMAEFAYPASFHKDAFKKIRFSFQANVSREISSIHVFIQFFNKEHHSVLDIPFYLSKDDIYADTWDFKEFGYDMTENELINRQNIDKIGISIWNVESKGQIYIDDLLVEFITTNGSLETIH